MQTSTTNAIRRGTTAGQSSAGRTKCRTVITQYVVVLRLGFKSNSYIYCPSNINRGKTRSISCSHHLTGYQKSRAIDSEYNIYRFEYFCLVNENCCISMNLVRNCPAGSINVDWVISMYFEYRRPKETYFRLVLNQLFWPSILWIQLCNENLCYITSLICKGLIHSRSMYM